MLALQAGTALNTEADAFFLESSDSDSALETSAAPLLLSDEGAQQSVSQTQAADSVSTAQAQIAAGKQVQFQQPKRQAGCRSDSHVPSRNPRHNSSNVAPSGAADQHLQQKQQPVLHQQAAGSPQKPAKFLQNGRLSKFAKDSKHTELTVAGVPPRKSALGGADLAQKSSVKEQQAQVRKMLFVQFCDRSLQGWVLDMCEQFAEAILQALVLCMSMHMSLACPTYEQYVCGVAH